MAAFELVLAALRKLRDADASHQREADGLLQRYFDFIKSRPFDPRQPINGRGLRMRRCRDKDGRVRRIAWTRRVLPALGRPARPGSKGMTATLREPFKMWWVFRYARDWYRRDTYKAFDVERSHWNAKAGAIADSRRRLRLALENRWGPRATPGDCDRAGVAARLEGLTGREIWPLAGAAAFDYFLMDLEERILGVIDDYRRAFDGSATVEFGPHLTHREDGFARLQWGFDRVRRGGRPMADYLPWPTDRLMRRLHVPRPRRKAVTPFVKRLRDLGAAYRQHVNWLQALLSRVRKAVKAAAVRGAA
jgi:hypothetical protein